MTNPRFAKSLIFAVLLVGAACGTTANPVGLPNSGPNGVGGMTSADPEESIISALSIPERGGAAGNLGFFFSASLGNTDTVVIPSRESVKVPFVTELMDRGESFDVENSRFTPNTRFPYRICASVATFAQDFDLTLYVDGIREKSFARSVHGVAQGCRTIFLNRGQFAEVHASRRSCGEPITLAPNPFWNWATAEATGFGAYVESITDFVAPSSVFTTVPYRTSVKGGGCLQFDPATSRFTIPSFPETVPPPVADRIWDYNICASLASPAQDFELDIFINGSREKAIAVSKGGVAQGCRTVRLKVGDYFEIKLYQNQAAALAFTDNSSWDWLTVDQPKVASVTDVRAFLGDTTAFSAPSGQFTTVNYAYPTASTTGIVFDPVTHQVTAPRGDSYVVCASLLLPSTDFELDLFVNGIREKAFVRSNYGIGTGCRTVLLNKSDLLDVRVYQASGATVNVPSNPFWNWLTVNETGMFL